jgi:LDH2 family malate/lactate/ureidoglycolate dehydrogenase
MRFNADRLERFACELYVAGGMDAGKAAIVARLQVLTDAMGRRTHGLAYVPTYLADIGSGRMRATGEPEIVADNGVTSVWDGKYLPGLWLVAKAIDVCIPRAAQYGIAAIAIRKSHHIGCLAALVKQAADKGYVALLFNSDPTGKRVAPYGGTEALYTPNPFAIGYPGEGHPVLVDLCASITTTSMTRQKVAEGKQFEHEWLIDAEGRPTRDPEALEHATPRGSILPLGGLEYGHKGFGIGLMIEALSQGLAGYGRKDAPKNWGGNVFLQVIDPKRFAGLDAFTEQMDFLSDRARANKPIDPKRPVRIPGDAAAKGIADALENGIEIDERTWQTMLEWAEKLKVPAPE